MLASRSFLCLAAFFIATIGLIQAGDGVLSSFCSLHHTAYSNRQCKTKFPGYSALESFNHNPWLQTVTASTWRKFQRQG